jgi:hypothetical protein
MVAKKIVDVLPDYLEQISPAKRQQFLAAFKAFKDETPLKLSTTKEFKIPVRPLEVPDVGRLASWVEKKKKIRTTKARKVYVGFGELAQGECSALRDAFAKIADGMVAKINEEHMPQGHRMAEMKKQHIVLLTYGAKTERKFGFREQLQKFLNQLAHVDAPAVPRGTPAGVVPLYSLFVTMTRRSATSLYFDLSLDELLCGKTWGEDEQTNEWILWRLMFAHMCAFEMQAVKDKETARTGERQVSEPGSAILFESGKLWHAGMEGLGESTQPEVLLLLQYCLKPILEKFDRCFNAAGGFGQHPWTAEIAQTQLQEVQEYTYDVSEVSLSLMVSENTHTPTGFRNGHVQRSRRGTFSISSDIPRQRSQ